MSIISQVNHRDKQILQKIDNTWMPGGEIRKPTVRTREEQGLKALQDFGQSLGIQTHRVTRAEYVEPLRKLDRATKQEHT